MSYDNLPDELKQYPHWCCWKYSHNKTNPEKPLKIPVKEGKAIDPTDPTDLVTYEQALAAVGNYDGIAFVLLESNPYAVIDLDDTKGNAANFAIQMKVYESFVSYAEISPSGKGLHIWVKGKVPLGRNKEPIEIYSNKRVITCTGNVYRQAPIADYHELLNQLWVQMLDGREPIYRSNSFDGQQTQEDMQIIQVALAAANGDKFRNLYDGKWQGEYPSQSQADFALIDMLAFYSDNREQIARIFLASALGNRIATGKKKKHEKYIPDMISKAFDRKIPQVNIEGLRDQLKATLEMKSKTETEVEEIEEDFAFKPKQKSNIQIPPGLIGEMTEFIFKSSPRPVLEIALLGAIGLMSGICGRSFNISGTGLNQYLLLLAPTGTGKESMAGGVGKIMKSVCSSIPTANAFLGPAEISSSQALSRYMSKASNSFISIVGEFGLYMHQLCSQSASSHMVGLRKLILDLYNKSGNNDVLRPTIYSDAGKNTSDVISPALTILGESTPERFYEVLSEDMIYEGFLPRFTCVEYYGKRPSLNKNHDKVFPEKSFVERVAGLCAHSIGMNSQNKVTRVNVSPDAEKDLDSFNEYCDSKINAATTECIKQLWTRGHMKVLKLAGIVAVGINPYAPVVDVDCVRWAAEIVMRDIMNFSGRFTKGEIGKDERTQEAILEKATLEWISQDWETIKKHKKGNEKMHADKVVPYSYLHSRVHFLSAFRTDKQGATAALKRCIKTMIEKGDLAEISRGEVANKYASGSVCYAVTNPQLRRN